MQIGLIDVLILFAALLGVIIWIVLAAINTKKLLRIQGASHHLGNGKWRIYGPLPIIPTNWLWRIMAAWQALVMLIVTLNLTIYFAGLSSNVGWTVYGSFVEFVEVNGRQIIEQDYSAFRSGVFRGLFSVFMVAGILHPVLRKFMESIWLMLPAQKMTLRLGIYALNIPIFAYIYVAYMHHAVMQFVEQSTS